jgi:hypothetical protein
MGDEEQAGVIGRYAFGSGSDEFFDVAKNRQGVLTIKREGGTERRCSMWGRVYFTRRRRRGPNPVRRGFIPHRRSDDSRWKHQVERAANRWILVATKRTKR